MQFNLTTTGSDFGRLEDIPPTQEQSGYAGMRSFLRDTPILGMATAEMAKASANRLGARLDTDAAAALAREYGPNIQPVEPGHYTEAAARILYQRAAEKQTDQIIDSQTPWPWQPGGSVLGTGSRAIMNSLVTLADPSNLAAMYMPIGRLGASLAARELAAGGMGGRFGWRALAGGAQGAVGMGALEAVSIPLHRDLGDETSLGESALNIGFGGLLGAATHGLLGGLRPRAELPPAIRDAPPEVNQAALQTSLAQHLQDQPVAVDHVYAAAPQEAPPVANWLDEIRATKDRRIRQDRLYADMTPAELRIAHESGTAENTQIDRAFVRQKLGDAGVAEYDAFTTFRARARFMEKIDPEEQAAMQGVDTERIREYMAAHTDFDTESAATLGRSLLLAAREMEQPNFIGSPAYVTMREAFRFAQEQGWNMDAVTSGLRGRMVELYGNDAPELFNRLFRQNADTTEAARNAITANRERNILDGDGMPPREEPAAPAASATSAHPELTARLQDAKTRAITAEQELQAAVQGLQDAGFPVKAAPELKAADEAIAQAEAHAKAFEAVANCLRQQ